MVLAAAALSQSSEFKWEGAATAGSSQPSAAAGKELSPEEDAARRKKEAQEWIAAWRAKQQK